MKDATGFSPGDFVVYPGHGLGKVTGLETKTIGGERGEWVVISFDHDRMVLRLPMHRARTAGLRGLSTRKLMEKAFLTLQGNRSRKTVMWNRRALEYSTKIKSGDPISIAEVVRDLHRQEHEPQASYSERQLYEQARDRLTREVAAIEGIDIDAATTKLEVLLKAA